MGLESTKKTDGIIQDQEGPADFGKLVSIQKEPRGHAGLERT
jgi:hypothetical protein